MSEPVHIAAIDAGSNAVRLSVARAYSALDIEPVHTERYPIRLAKAFSCGPASAKRFSRKPRRPSGISRSGGGIRVTRYRAVATSATREARNRKAFVAASSRNLELYWK